MRSLLSLVIVAFATDSVLCFVAPGTTRIDSLRQVQKTKSDSFARSEHFVPESVFQSTVRRSSARRIRATKEDDVEIGTTVDDPSSTTKKSIDVEKLNRDLENCRSGTTARNAIRQALAGSSEALYGSIVIPSGASDRPISDGDLAIQTKVRNKKYGIFDLIDLNGDRDADRASAGVLGIFLASSLSAIAANQNLPGPEIARFVVVWILSFTPLALVGYGIATPEKLQALLVSLQRTIFPTYRKRMIQHEAGHFLAAHLLGYPIQGYSTNAVKNAVEFYELNDPDVGLDRASQLGFDKRRNGESADDIISVISNADVPFFSKEGRGSEDVQTRSVFRDAKNYTENPFLKLPSQNQPQRSWPFRGFDHGTIDKLSVVSVAGVCAEILAYGNAEGGIADFSQLRQLFGSAEPELTERDIENRIRYSIGYTMSQLRRHLGALDALAQVMDRGGSVAECIEAIETCPNVSGNGILGDYELRRRQEFRTKGVGILERLLLGEKTADTEETRMVEGKGGGYKKDEKLIKLSGDDALYIALGFSIIFFVWASSGGLSLH